MLDDLLGALEALYQRGTRDPELADLLEKLHVRTNLQTIAEPHSVTEEPQLALRANFRVEQTDRAGRNVAGVFEFGFANPGALLVQGDQIRVGHVDLPAHFERLGDSGTLKLQREPSDRPCIVGHIVADLAVAPRDGSGQLPVLIADRCRDSIDFQLDDPLDGLAGQVLFDTLEELAKLPFGVGVFDREHRYAMSDLRQALDGSVPDFLSRAIGGDQTREADFPAGQLAEKSIVLQIGNFRFRLNVIEIVVLADLLSKLPDGAGRLLEADVRIVRLVHLWDSVSSIELRRIGARPVYRSWPTCKSH